MGEAKVTTGSCTLYRTTQNIKWQQVEGASDTNNCSQIYLRQGTETRFSGVEKTDMSKRFKKGVYNVMDWFSAWREFITW